MGKGRIKVANIMPLRAAFALAFVVLSSLQPGLFANANATGFHADNGITLSAGSPDHQHAAHRGHHDHADAVAADKSGHHSSGSESDTSCEVHCAPIHCVPADWSPVFPPSVGCAPETTLAVLQPREPVELKRPPRA
jgi:hypothetical protein